MNQTLNPVWSAAADAGHQLFSKNEPRTPAPTGGPVMSIDLRAAFRQLEHERRWSGGRNAVTLLKHRDFRLVLTALKAGTHLSRHNVRGTVLIQVLGGHIRVEILGSILNATAGQAISLDPNLAHEITAVEDAALLISIAWHEVHHRSRGEALVQAEPDLSSWDWRADESVWN